MGEVQSFSIQLPSGGLRWIGPEQPCFIIAEIGTNWHSGAARDASIAFQLIDVAAKAGCDAVKFQTYSPESVYVENAGKSAYLSAAGINTDIRDLIAERVMPPEMIPLVSEYANSKNITFMSSCFSLQDINIIDPHVIIHKLASYEISHIHLIDALSKLGKPVIFSTGASEYHDIDWTVERFRSNNLKNLVVLQCTAAYPAPDEAMNLSAIRTLRERYGVASGLSDHSPDPINAPLAAVSFGAAVIEKHITLDRKMAGPDHANSIEPSELADMVSRIRAVEAMLGDGRKKVEPAERELRAFARRGLQAIKPIHAGETLKEGENFAVLRPGKRSQGAHPRMIQNLQGRIVRHSIALGDGISQDDVG